MSDEIRKNGADSRTEHSSGKERNKKGTGSLSVAGRIGRIFVVLIMCSSLIITGVSAAVVSFDNSSRGDIVIVLDPGHGGFDTGAVNKSRGLNEATINLGIALACREKLSRYSGVRVYMTHTGVSNIYGKSSLNRRVSVAGEVGADIFISLHINSADNKSANGAEVFVPITKHDPRYNEQCTRLAEEIIDNLTALGLNSRGVKTKKSGGGRVYHFDDGTTEAGDYYYVIGEPISRLGIPGILIEHAFIDADADFLDSAEDLKRIGIADADAIAKHFGLKLRPENKDRTSSGGGSENAGHAGNDTYPTATASDDETDTALSRLEELIAALPDFPGKADADSVNEVREAYRSLSSDKRSRLDSQLFQKMVSSVTAYENAIRPVRIDVKEGSQLAIDRFDGQLLNGETASEAPGRVTVLSLMLELELFISPDAPSQYRNEGVLTYRVTSPDGTVLGENDKVTDGSVIAIMFNDTVLDSLTVRIG